MLDLYHLIRKFTWRESRHFWMTQRAEVYAASRGICWLCGYHVPVQSFSIDHIIPTSMGGTDELYNLRLVHHSCHHAYHRRKDHE